MAEIVRTEVRDGVLTITLDRPKANAIDVATSALLYAAFKRLQDDATLRVAIITGTGRFFSETVESHCDFINAMLLQSFVLAQTCLDKYISQQSELLNSSARL